MKKLFFLLILFLSVSSSFAQNPAPKWALSVGAGASTVYQIRNIMPGGRVALSRNTDLCSHFSFKPEVGLSLVQFRNVNVYPTSTQNGYYREASFRQLFYLDISPAFALKVTPQFTVHLAPFAAYMVLSHSQRNATTLINNEVVSRDRYGYFGNYFMRSLDLGLRAKAEVAVTHKIALFGQYSYGFSNLYPMEYGIFSSVQPFLHTQTLNLGVTIGLTCGPKAVQ